MKLTLQELTLLCALAEKLGWIAGPPVKWRFATYPTLPPTYYMVDDHTRGSDVGYRAFLRTTPMERPPTHRMKGDPNIWQLVFTGWNPLESLDDAWVLVEAIAKDDFAKAPFMFLAPRVSIAMSSQEVARGICLAAAKAWGISTELVR